MHIANPQLTITIGATMTAFTAMVLRFRASRKPITTRKLLLPPIAMSSGFLMFLMPMLQIPLMWALVSFLLGAILFSYPLIRYSQLERSGGHIYLVRSKAFIFILLGLLVVRLGLRGLVEQYVTLPQTGAIFFIVAFGMLLPWRLTMYRQYRRLQQVKL
jgi:membrane protein CcdC involved in cytochrome C biogenesis